MGETPVAADADVSGRPRVAQIVNEAAAQLQEPFGEGGIPAAVLMREIERRGGYARDSVLPSDFCYNVVNKDPHSFTHCLLARVGRGRYTHVGPDFAYTGPVFWKPKHEVERQVGHWKDGTPRLEFDPRRQPDVARPRPPE